MFLKVLVGALMMTAFLASPSLAGSVVVRSPELDSSALSLMAAGFAGIYAGFRIYKLKNKS